MIGWLLASAATLLGQTPPANDDFAYAAAINGTNTVVGGSNVGATKEPGEPEHAGVVGGKSVWWKWQAPANGFATISTLGSVSAQFGGPLDTILAVYTGNAVSNLVEVASNDDGSVDATSEVTFQVNAGTLYQIAIDGYAASTNDPADSGSIRLTIGFSLTPPTAPAWGPLPGLGGQPLASYGFAGKVVVLNFWATTCGGCVTEIPGLVQLNDHFASSGLVVVGVSLDQSPDGVNPPLDLVRSFAQANNVTYPVVMSNPDAPQIESAYGVSYLPTTFVIDRQNRVVRTFGGSQSFDTFRQAVLPLLYGPPKLSATLINGKLRFAWAISELSYLLQQTDQATGGNWSTVQGTRQSDGRNWFIDVAPQTGTRFFRLHLQ